MTAKALYDSLKDELENRSGSMDSGLAERIEAALKPSYDLLRVFERERNEQPFRSQAPCPYCETGTVTYDYRAPLVGTMKCDACDCVSLNL